VSSLPPVHPLAATGFARAAEEYESARPSYAPQAVAWLAERCGLGAGTTVVDLAAGTGKLTRLLAGTGARVVAVEPVAAMRETLVRVVPGVEALDGRAEAIPLPDGFARAVTAAQAFHWFGEGAPAEIARVLEPGGSLAVVWNQRDRSNPVQVALQEIHDRHRPDGHAGGRGDWRGRIERSGRFGELEERRFPHVHVLPREQLVTRTLSISFVAAAPEDERERILDEVRAMTRGLPDEVELTYETAVFVAARLG
jgi:SAM-dependent methyltransferase